MARRLLSLWFPKLASDASRRRRPVEGAFALVLRAGNAEHLHCLNREAERKGLRQGMSLADARAILPELATRAADLAAQKLALEVLRRWASRYSPMIATEGVLTCMREGCTIDTLGVRRLANGEHRLKSGAEMARLFHRYPAAIRRTVEIAAVCAFRLSDLRYQYPDEALDGETAQARLERLSREGLRWRYPDGASPKIIHRVEKELTLIREID